MPLFIFFSGYFSKNAEEAQGKAFLRALFPYFILNSLYYILQTILQKELVFSFLHDSWMLWYFLSLFTMSVMLPFIIKIKYSLILLFCFSLVIGFFSEFGTFLSLSRTICFGGYFLLGYYCNINIFEKIKKLKIAILCVAIIISILLFVFFTSAYGLSHVRGIIYTLHRSTAYKNMEIGRITGFMFRIITIPLAILFGSLVLAFMPDKRTIFTGLGKRSIIIFVFHGYFVRLMQKYMKLINSMDDMGMGRGGDSIDIIISRDNIFFVNAVILPDL
jgi:fucose 4-O-acetylase-like acetyltransferase